MESILSDGGKQYQSKLLDLVYEDLDIRKLKTTPFHPQRDGQSEVTVKTVKKMIAAYVDEDQMTWDLNLNKLAYAYNTSRHSATGQTPFEMMFGRKPRIPIDLIIPPTDLLEREKILSEYKILNEHGEVSVMEDYEEIVEKNLPVVATNYLSELKDKLKTCYRIAEINRNCRMDKAKIDHDRKIKKFEYNIGDFVLTDHPKLKKGLSHGLAHKYYGPFVIVGKNDNNCDYLIKLASSPRAKVKQVHKNRLKIYFHIGHTLPTIKEEPEDVDNQGDTSKKKRVYKKNPENPRWKNVVQNNDDNAVKDTDSACVGSTENAQIHTNSKDSSSHSESSSNDFSSDEKSDNTLNKRKKKLTKFNRKNTLANGPRKSIRVSKPPDRFMFN